MASCALLRPLYPNIRQLSRSGFGEDPGTMRKEEGGSGTRLLSLSSSPSYSIPTSTCASLSENPKPVRRRPCPAKAHHQPLPLAQPQTVSGPQGFVVSTLQAIAAGLFSQTGSTWSDSRARNPVAGSAPRGIMTLPLFLYPSSRDSDICIARITTPLLRARARTGQQLS